MKRIEVISSPRRRRWNARGSWYFRVVELLDIVRVELELQQSNRTPRCSPAPGRVEKLVVIQTHTFNNRTKTTVCGIPSDLTCVPSRSTRAASSLPSGQLWAWASRTRAGLSDQVQPHLPSPTSSTTCNRADAQSSTLTGRTGSMTLYSLHLASRQLVLDLASARDLLQRRRSATSPISKTIRTLTVST